MGERETYGGGDRESEERRDPHKTHLPTLRSTTNKNSVSLIICGVTSRQ